ncbi:DUF6000 family protein [Streptomyces sp. NPDC054794]
MLRHVLPAVPQAWWQPSSRERARTRPAAQKLGKARSEISPREPGVPLDGGWREDKAAAWFVTVSGRSEFREGLGELLLASEGLHARADSTEYKSVDKVWAVVNVTQANTLKP